MSGHEEKEEKPKKKSKLPLLVIILILLLGAGAGAYFFLFAGSDSNAEEEVEKHYEFATLPLEPFYVNLGDQTSFLKAVVSLQFNKTLLEEAVHAASEVGHGSSHGEEAEGHEDDDEEHEEEDAEGGGGSGGGGEAAATPPVLTEKMPLLRDAIIGVLSAKSAKEVLSVDGKDLLKEEILEVVNEVLGFDEEIFVKVYFVEFLVQ
jgi:flagellar basal body-associated protein FliL